jgi:hypothetical protein
MNYELRITNYKLQITNYELQIKRIVVDEAKQYSLTCLLGDTAIASIQEIDPAHYPLESHDHDNDTPQRYLKSQPDLTGKEIANVPEDSLERETSSQTVIDILCLYTCQALIQMCTDDGKNDFHESSMYSSYIDQMDAKCSLSVNLTVSTCILLCIISVGNILISLSQNINHIDFLFYIHQNDAFESSGIAATINLISVPSSLIDKDYKEDADMCHIKDKMKDVHTTDPFFF